MKEKVSKECPRRTRKLFKTKSFSTNLIKRIEYLSSLSCKALWILPKLNKRGDENMDNKMKKLMIIMYRAFKSGDDVNRLYVLINHPTRVGYDTRSIFKRSLTGLNSEFSSSKVGCLPRLKP